MPDLAPVTPIVIPRGRSAAERRIAAVAALHQPRPILTHLDALGGPQCGECQGRWPCPTARLLGAWPGEPDA